MTTARQTVFALPRLYPIFDVDSLVRRRLDLGEAARSFADAGVGVLQLRDKASSPNQILEHAALLSEAFTGTEATLILNDRPDLVRLAGWDAVHLGHRDLPPEAASALFREERLIVGVSTHTESQVSVAEAGVADYVAIGPVFRTTTKADTEPVVGLEGVRRARQLTRKPLVAIGGITLENAVSVIEVGADAVAVIGDLLAGGGSLTRRVQDFLRRLR